MSASCIVSCIFLRLEWEEMNDAGGERLTMDGERAAGRAGDGWRWRRWEMKRAERAEEEEDEGGKKEGRRGRAGR